MNKTVLAFPLFLLSNSLAILFVSFTTGLFWGRDQTKRLKFEPTNIFLNFFFLNFENKMALL